MKAYLVTQSIGPVQSMIGAARRTRDLWCGSWLLSEVSRAAARVFDERHPGCLIFPCVDDSSQLLPQNSPGDQANIANVLRAQVSATDEQQLASLCADAAEAARQRLADIGNSARSQIKAGLAEALWTVQLEDQLEIFNAWVELEGNDYRTASGRLGATLAARKVTRNFLPAPQLSDSDGRRPKSSLDGAYESVLPKPRDRDTAGLGKTDRKKLGLSPGEQLDALGIIKRLAGDADQFTAYARIAADDWINSLGENQLQRLRDAYAPLMKLDLATGTRGNDGIYASFPYDAQLLFDFRLENALSVYRDSPEELVALQTLKTTLQEIAKEKNPKDVSFGSPVPYAVILQADGDRMGELLSRAESAAQSRDISRALHGFATSVRAAVREFRGHAIYSGGDDVLALLPLQTATDCAAALAARFKIAMGDIAAQLEIPAELRPSLSAGLSIGHLMEPLGSLRERALAAENHAKGNSLSASQQRNALAITVGIRAGADLRWRARWDDQEALHAIDSFVDAYQNQKLPGKIGYTLRAIQQRLDRCDDSVHPDRKQLQLAEVRRTLDRARADYGRTSLSKEIEGLLLERAQQQPLEELANTLIVCRWLAARSAGMQEAFV